MCPPECSPFMSFARDTDSLLEDEIRSSQLQVAECFWLTYVEVETDNFSTRTYVWSPSFETHERNVSC